MIFIGCENSPMVIPVATFPHYILNCTLVAMYLWKPKDQTTIHKTQHSMNKWSIWKAVIFL